MNRRGHSIEARAWLELANAALSRLLRLPLWAFGMTVFAATAAVWVILFRVAGVW